MHAYLKSARDLVAIYEQFPRRVTSWIVRSVSRLLQFGCEAARAAKRLGERVYRTGSAGRYTAGDISLSYIRPRVCHVILPKVRDITS